MNTFLAVLNAFPAVIGAVQAVEAAIPLPKSGQQKLNIILGAATTAWELGQVAQQISKANAITAVTAMANIAVTGLNNAGVFKTTAAVSSN